MTMERQGFSDVSDEKMRRMLLGREILLCSCWRGVASKVKSFKYKIRNEKLLEIVFSCINLRCILERNVLVVTKFSHFLFTENFPFFRETDWSEISRKISHFSRANEMRKNEKFSQNDFSFSLQILTCSIYHHTISNIKDCFSNTKIYYFHGWILQANNNYAKLQLLSWFNAFTPLCVLVFTSRYLSR